MNQIKNGSVYHGSCHCGAVRFRVWLAPGEQVIAECNCSICRKKGFLHLIIPPEQFELLAGEESLTTYTFNTGVAKHLFCSICGMHPFYRPRSHPEAIDVNIRCLDGDELPPLRIEPFDGANWEQNIEALRSVIPEN
jgi:hypothetical protein